jgi:pantoate--beta-alanine ligase
MELISSPPEMQRRAELARQAGERIALVPTMGALHEGHLTLIREGRRRASMLVVSIFVNPAQFGPNEDFRHYPRALAKDCELIRNVPVDVLFAPDTAAMYPPGAETWVEVTELSRGLCGAARPGHFRGVATVVAKLFNLVKPHVALFGEKDFQQLRIIRQMVRDLNFDLEIAAVPTVREPDGLAMSSRNTYLAPAERKQALAISQSLAAARERWTRGAADANDLLGAAWAVLRGAPVVEVEYLEAVDAETLVPVRDLSRPLVVAIAARVGSTRLIDNVLLTFDAERSAPRHH